MINALAAAPEPCGPNAPVVLMVSGGSDSTALLVRAAEGTLDLAACGGPSRVDPARLHVLHINHCLRGAASDGDEAFVRDLAARLGVSCTVRRVDVPALVAAGANMEEAARRERYAAAWELAGELAAVAGAAREAARIAVAHTADDRAETFLMRALAGAGAAGLSGMRRARGIVVRPLLDETRADLRSYLAQRGIGWREDATNDEDGPLRSYVRHRVVPPMTARNPAFARTLAGPLDVLADEDDLLDRLAARALADMRLPARAGTAVLDVRALASCEPALARRAVRRALAGLMGEEDFRAARLEARHVEALLALARSGAGSHALPLGVDARIDRGVLVLRLPGGACPSPADAVLPVPGALSWGDVLLEARVHEVGAAEDAAGRARDLAVRRAAQGLAEGRDFVLVDAAALGLAGDAGALEVGSFEPGERMRPFGMRGGKLVADVLGEAGVAVRDRAWVPVVRARDACGGRVCVWVGGIRLDARAAWGPQTRVLVELGISHCPTCADG